MTTDTRPTDTPPSHFGTLTPRMAAWREELVGTTPSVCVERALLTTQTYREHQHEPMVIRRALMLKNVLEHMSIYIEPATLIAGNQASTNRAAPIMPEYAMDWVIAELDEFDRRPGDRFTITEQAKDDLRGIAPYWHKNTLKDRGLALMPPESRRFYDLGLIHPEGNITSGDAHIAISYSQVLTEGLAGYRARTQACLDNLDMTRPGALRSSHFYRAVLITLDAVTAFAHRYADLAETLAADETDPARRDELATMARNLRVVPEHPATGFHQAVQSVWLVHLALQIESNGHSLSYGRFDQYLNPFYEADLAAGRITEDRAVELLTNLWLKTLTVAKIRGWSHTRFSAGGPLYQNVTIGGQTTDGKDAVNPTSWLVLRSVAQTRLPQPNLTVRYHHGLSDDFLLECIEVMRLGFGMPALNSDEVIIPSLVEKGVSEEDAYNFSAIGCVEVAVPGKWGYRCTGMSFLNFMKTLLIAMNDGVDPASGTRLTSPTTHFTAMTSFDEVMTAWEVTVRELQRQCIVLDAAADTALEENVADILCSALTDDCIGRGRPLKEGGAVYDFVSGLQVGIANLGDALAAIKKCVFEDASVTTGELWAALQDDFAGERGREIQALLQAAPKYGNDDDYVDRLLVDAYEIAIDEILKGKNTRYGRGPIGGTYYAGTSSISANVPQGASTAATPDGRNAGVPLAEGCSPAHGADVNGPTAVFKSVGKLPTRDITGGVLLNQKVNPQMLAKEEDRRKLVMLLRAFFNRLDGFHVQYNVVDRDTLLDAQAHPEKHRDLIVRVAGYSAFFNVLSKATQDDIIARTEQCL
ncbi:formate C-acetyltransferase [Austwickia chelonae]|uniref:Putative pyruvate formate-lyase n=1 Tax=Austwickia chelonae NBRC 105200 TaxID=1184607 RepID=K6W9B3_9MICO|nr:glycyl radical protein [Austwickia chelonae]GAB78437.1 putative pyruvate formate-lyase [Austwickia chelonae NBRC 105200]SEW39521.1 formate C-acetyltransferase [Austwickia chelonae]